MNLDKKTLTEKAEATADLLCQTIEESGLIEALWSSYEETCRKGFRCGKSALPHGLEGPMTVCGVFLQPRLITSG